MTEQVINAIPETSSSSSSSVPQRLSSKREVLEALSTSFLNIESSRKIDASTLWDFMDMERPVPLDEMLTHDPTIQNHLYGTANADARVGNEISVGFGYIADPGELVAAQMHTYLGASFMANFFVERPFERNLSANEQDIRNTVATVAGAHDPENNIRNNWNSRATRVATLFHNTLPDTAFTSYHHITLYIISHFVSLTQQVVQQRACDTIGLQQYFQQMLGNPTWNQHYYPILWDHWDQHDIEDFQWYFDWLFTMHPRFQHDNQMVPLVVLSDAGSEGQQLQNIAAPQQQHPFGGIGFLDRIMALMTPRDREMIMFFCPNSLLQYNPNQAHLGVVYPVNCLPEYIFENHVMDFMAHNTYMQPMARNFGAYTRNWISNGICLVTTALLCRIQDYCGRSVAVAYTDDLDRSWFDVQVWSTTRRFGNGVSVFTGGHYVTPCYVGLDVLSMVTGTRILAQVMDVNATMVVRGPLQNIESIQAKSVEGRLQWVPSDANVHEQSIVHDLNHAMDQPALMMAINRAIATKVMWGSYAQHFYFNPFFLRYTPIVYAGLSSYHYNPFWMYVRNGPHPPDRHTVLRSQQFTDTIDLHNAGFSLMLC